jgi:lipid-A-disaccharide synthase
MVKFFIIAGESSGDLLGSELIKELKIQYPSCIFVGVGGRLMQEQGLKSIFPITDLMVMGFIEVLPHLFTILTRIKQTALAIKHHQPDYLITIDSPDFCFRVVKKIVKQPIFNTIKKIHLVAPSVWAYRPKRAKKIAKLYNLLLTLLPFEPPYFTKYGLKTVFIGHPLLQKMPSQPQIQENNLQFRKKYNINLQQTILLATPGSRMSEIKYLLPIFIEVINQIWQQQPDLVVVLSITQKTENIIPQMANKIKARCIFIDHKQKDLAFSASNYALAKSGTNTLEIAMHQTPMVVVYKANIISYLIIKILTKIKFANLLNLLQNKEIIVELLQNNCQVNKIYSALLNLMHNKNLAQQQINDCLISLNMMQNQQNPMQIAVKNIQQL